MLDNITDAKIKSMSLMELEALSSEVRDKIMTTVSTNGGHLSSNLGTVELTIALHYVFDFPKDKLVFDVGHQCYTHKLLSGRGDAFDTLRKLDGLSGFPKREESEYDCYNTGHAGTSVSAAMGLCKARDLKGEDYDVIAVIGDGSFNNGLVYEAFNSLKMLGSKFLLIINDNGMSITPTVGSMREYLDNLSRDDEQAEKMRRHADIFERFGFAYDGVYDGHDIQGLIEKLKECKKIIQERPLILHVATKKGKGYEFCESDPMSTHGIDSYPRSFSYSRVLGETLSDMAEGDDRVVAVTAAMTPSLGLDEFFKRFPERAVDVGICEEHAAVLCASMATQGLKPYYAIYSTFLQRSFDEIVLDICSQNLPVTLCVDHAGIVGADGETHQGVFDLSYLSLVPNLTVVVPKDIAEFERYLRFSLSYPSPLAIRYPADGERIFESEEGGDLLRWEKLDPGDGRVAILACGERALSVALQACENLRSSKVYPAIVNARVVKPLDRALLNSLDEKLVVTVEDNVLAGGFGQAVSSYFSESDTCVKCFGYKDEFIPQGTVRELMARQGVTAREIQNFILSYEIG